MSTGKNLSLREKFQLANSRHLSALDLLLSKYEDGRIQDDDDEGIPFDQVGLDLSDEEQDDEDEDEFDFDFKKIFAGKPNKYGQEGAKKFTSTPRNDTVLRALKEQPKFIDSSPIVTTAKKAFKEPAKAQGSILTFFNFRKGCDEESSISMDGNEISKNDVLIPKPKTTKESNENRPPLPGPFARYSDQTPGRKDSARPSLTLVSAANTPSLAPTTSRSRHDREPESDEGEVLIVPEDEAVKSKHAEKSRPPVPPPARTSAQRPKTKDADPAAFPPPPKQPSTMRSLFAISQSKNSAEKSRSPVKSNAQAPKESARTSLASTQPPSPPANHQPAVDDVEVMADEEEIAVKNRQSPPSPVKSARNAKRKETAPPSPPTAIPYDLQPTQKRPQPARSPSQSPTRSKPSPKKSSKKAEKSRPPEPPPSTSRHQSPPPKKASTKAPKPPRAPERDDFHEADASKVISDWTAKNDSRCVVQPQLLQLLSKKSRYSSTKTDAEKAALKFQPRKRAGDPLLDLIRQGAKLNVKKKSS